MGFGFTQSLLYGVIVSSTDPGTHQLYLVSVLTVFTQLGVDIDLHSIILGESALNDAVSLVTSHTINDYASYSRKHMSYGFKGFAKSFGVFLGTLFGSLLCGAFFGFFNAFLTKATQLRKIPIVETAVFLILSYSSFLAAEMFGMVGIVSVLFCAMFQVHYTRNNLSEESKNLADKILQLICFFFENFLFSYMGITVFVFSKHIWDIGFIILSFAALMIARGFTVYALCFLLNIKRTRKIPINFQHVLFFSGLKGAISFALAIENTNTPIRRLLFTSSIVLVLITVLVFGGLMSQLISFLKIP
ncbi:Sodium/hydrogen exchanger 9 [Thelohanellus kitauei]|uniref:Sodium/hydrogen exchanger 9 n=1 Tax=Thelohanellus kitauei TaxID=669202 RepID=A0A0C2IX26_THEKT|nr:Sodium/hydrogen exchanger 9 [Thelohanellus kitauei]